MRLPPLKKPLFHCILLRWPTGRLTGDSLVGCPYMGLYSMY